MKKTITIFLLFSSLIFFNSCLEILYQTEDDPILSTASDVLDARDMSTLIGKTITLTAVNSKYVSADNSNNILIANKTVDGPFEQFKVIDAGKGKIALRCIGNNKYVCASSAGNNSLVANRSRIGSWEKFIIDDSGNKLGFLASVNNKFVSADKKGSNPLIANRTFRKSWETFTWGVPGDTPGDDPGNDPGFAYTTITSPGDASVFDDNDIITVTVDAQDPDGVDALHLWIDGSYHSNSTSKPYQFSVTGLSSGSHSLKVRARDTLGNSNDSKNILITIESTGGYAMITHIGTTSDYDKDGKISINKPSGTKSGDLLVLFLHRTDDDLPLRVSGWTKIGECYKKNNAYHCATENECINWETNTSFCKTFRCTSSSGSVSNGTGHDLAQSIFYKRVSSNEPSSYSFNLNRDSSGHAGWAILTTLRGANTSSPVRDWAHRGDDQNSDSVFPSVYGSDGDMLLLSQSFDDRKSRDSFGAPGGTSLFGFINGSDETGYLFGGDLNSTGKTGDKTTTGAGGPNRKDALISLVIKPQ